MEYYANQFSCLGSLVKKKPKMQECIELLKLKGYSLIIATNPMFPPIVVFQRLKWAGIDSKDFIYCSNYNSHSSTKPHVKFYQEIADKLELNVSSCLMVGNDKKDDMVASKIGMHTYLLTDQSVNDHVDVAVTYKGSSNNFFEFVKGLPELKNLKRLMIYQCQ